MISIKITTRQAIKFEIAGVISTVLENLTAVNFGNPMSEFSNAMSPLITLQ